MRKRHEGPETESVWWSSYNNFSVPCHAMRKTKEGPDTARLTKPRQEQSRSRGWLPPERSTRAEILPSCPSIDRSSKDAEIGLESRTFQSACACSNHGAISDNTKRTETTLRNRSWAAEEFSATL
ncbi:hypothetical protein T265_10034 [Opisthorchis viverrini]|uniref:Uncharacterized protein n=1 Tax=Opisthorchis viverrini TaxID=6198 RepID=A0A074Z3U4_OPIVI|nr:hypothetical protein T265_10034 [Opisthorchis viverrini]KER21708.1 hypothetical protein T265_10034 [Opisthorchis viverrini]